MLLAAMFAYMRPYCKLYINVLECVVLVTLLLQLMVASTESFEVLFTCIYLHFKFVETLSLDRF